MVPIAVPPEPIELNPPAESVAPWARPPGETSSVPPGEYRRVCLNAAGANDGDAEGGDEGIPGGPGLGDSLRAAAANCRFKRRAAGDDLFALAEHDGVAGDGARGENFAADEDDIAELDRARREDQRAPGKDGRDGGSARQHDLGAPVLQQRGAGDAALVDELRAADGGENRNPAGIHRLDAPGRDGGVGGGALEVDRLHAAPVHPGSDGVATGDDLKAGGVDRSARRETSEDVHRTAADCRVECASAGVHIERAAVDDGGVQREAAGIEHGQPA